MTTFMLLNVGGEKANPKIRKSEMFRVDKEV